MTDQPTVEQPPVAVTPRKNSKLEQLHALYAPAKAKADAAAADLKQVTDGIKAELVRLAPDQPRVELSSALGPPLRLVYAESWRIDAGKLKVEAPETYVRFARKSGSWSLKPVGSQG